MADSNSAFIARASSALADANLQIAMNKARAGFVAKRHKAITAIDNFDALRDKATAVRDRSIKYLPLYLARFEKTVREAGGHVHWASSADDMRRIVLDICQQAGARTVSKGKSMVAEEVDLNEALEAAGITPVETDLGEYILQLAQEKPSHIIAPALHKTRQQIIDLFEHHHKLGERDLTTIEALVAEARTVIRQRFIDADVGITGANILVAETGSAVLVTNEGNGDLCASLPATHIVTTSIDKVVATMADANAILRVLARSATGQPISTYTSFYSAKTAHDRHGPENFHVVLLDNGRSDLPGTPYQPMLRCIKCGACMNHCPVYQQVGGHSYDAVYPGPMGSVLTPLLRGKKNDHALANASTFCGRCEAVCPVKIPLPQLLRQIRNDHSESGSLSSGAIRGFMWLSRKPRLYRFITSVTSRLMGFLGHSKGHIKRWPFSRSWTAFRRLPTPPTGGSFQQQWHNAMGKNRGKGHD
jgi:L-lactate dehydrogenase complex protein LldF